MHRQDTTIQITSGAIAALILTIGFTMTGCTSARTPVPIPALHQINNAPPTTPRRSEAQPGVFPAQPAISPAQSGDHAAPTGTNQPESPEASPDLPRHPTLPDLIRYAETNNPTLHAARADWHAADYRTPQARSLPDPTLTVGYEEMDRQTRIGVSQMFPLFGKRSLRGQAASEMAAGAQQQLERARREVVRQVIDGWSEFVFLHRAIDITQTSIQLVRQLEQVAAARVRAGAPAADLIRAQVELDRIQDELRTLQDRLSPTAAQLNNALGRPANAPVPTPPTPRGSEAQPGVLDRIPLSDLDEQQLFERLHHENPEILAMQREMSAARAEMQLARRENLPDLMIGVDYMRQPEMDGFGIMASINLPIWQDRNRARIREATSRFHAAGHRIQEHRLFHEAHLQQALFQLRDATRKIDLYEQTLLPRAEQSLRATETAYRAGAVDFLALVDAYRLPLEFELARARARADRDNAYALIEQLAGRQLLDDIRNSQPENRSDQPERRSP